MRTSVLKSYKHTLCASYIGHITQAIINNFTPLLFLTFEKQYNISLSKITLLVCSNFILQLVIDAVAASFVDKIGYRKCIVTAHLLCMVGLVCLGILPAVMSNAFGGIFISMIMYALGGGLIEVLIAPIVEACPTANKNSCMSLLHFFYSAGHVGVVIVSAVFFFVLGIANWRVLAILWAIIPLFNTVYFLLVPIYTLQSDNEKQCSLKELIRSKIFLFFILLMFLSGASEQGMNQWASAFAESALMNSSFSKHAKVIGDLLGPCMFAFMMGMSRLIYSKHSKSINLEHLMTAAFFVCATCYIGSAVVPHPAIKLMFCGLCGLSIGIAWPGIYLLAPKHCGKASTASFALLALGGDLGCAAGPAAVGLVSEHFCSINAGIFTAFIFPVLLLLGMIFLCFAKRK